jgi:leucyl aminopeptidase
MFETDGSVETLPLSLVREQELPGWLDGQSAAVRAWLKALRFRAARHELVVLPGEGTGAGGAVLGLGPLAELRKLEPWHVAGLPSRLPGGSWRITNVLPAPAATQAALGWAHGTYQYERYKARSEAPDASVGLMPPDLADMTYVRRMSAALAMARDLINTPAGDLGPAELADAAAALAKRCGGEARLVRGDALREGYPAIHAVGRAAASEPRLIDLCWGDPSHPRVTLVGKGVCFDSGGLDIKNPASMLLMKKDMGGAACVLAVARMVMESALPVRLRVLVPAVENAIAGNAYRPGDVLRTRKGLTVEVGNTDAEGRLVLCDALAAADAERPDLLIDMATLTGAARVALGPELPALFGTRRETVNALLDHGEALADPLWAMPLWEGYAEEISSKIADLNNVSGSTHAGAVIAALFLRKFVSDSSDWLHLDVFAWNPKERPGRPVGADVQAVRAVYALLAGRFG